jgi:hypothetical protein
LETYNKMDTFYNTFKVLVAYPRTRNLKEPTELHSVCHYKCDETECDFRRCTEFITTLKYPNQDVKTFVQDFITNIQKEPLSTPTPKYLADKVDGYQIVYRPETDMKAYNIIHLRREDASGNSRTGVIELNSERFTLLNPSQHK